MDIPNNGITRRKMMFHTASAAGLVAAGIVPAMGADPSKSDPGPANSPLDGQNADSMWPPATDSKSLVQNFKYPFSFANKRAYQGGWSREVTVRELPVSKTLAGVNMRLTAGGVRELHWHTAGEWAIMLQGTARITSIDMDGKSFVADVKKYDLWFFPGGLRELHWQPNADEWQYYIAGKGRMTVVATGNKARTMDFQAGDVGYVEKTLLHYIENTGDSNLIFLEMFKSPQYQDLSLSEWLAHTPPELVMAHLKIDKATFDAIPKSGGA